MASLQALRDEVEAFCRARAQALRDEARRGNAPADLGAVERAHPAVVAPDTVRALHAAALSERTDPSQRPRLRALVAFLARAAVEARARAEDDALRRARHEPRRLAGAEHRLRDVWTAVALEPDRPRRGALAREAAAAELDLLGAVQRRWEAGAGAREALGAGVLPSPGLPIDETLDAEAASLLESTEDAWREVLAYALHRLDARLRPRPSGEAELHDLHRLGAEPLPGAFAPVERLRAVRRWLGDSCLGLEAEGRLHLEDGVRPLAEDFALDVPGDVRLVTPGEGLGHGPMSALLAAAGRARAAAAVSPAASLEAARMGDPAVRQAAGWVFRSVLRSERWLRRYLGHGRRLAREVARLSALAELGELRMLAARLPVMRALAEAGPVRASLDALAGAASEALWVGVPPGSLLPGLSGWPDELDGLRAASLAARLERAADERFDAEEFRNPGAARWLAGLWARGGELDAATLAQEVGGGPLTLTEVSARLLAALAA